MSRTKRIFVDLDGPLLDGKERHYYCYRNVLEKFGFKPVGIDEYWERKRALVDRRGLLKSSGAVDIYDSFLAEWVEMIESPDALALDKVQEGATDCLRRWKEEGIELTLVTMRKNRPALKDQLARLKLRPLLDAVLVCDHADGGQGKANAVRIRYSANTFGKSALWIGDTEIDWDAARSLGCDVVLVSNGLRNEAYLKSLHGAVVESSIASLKDGLLGLLNVN